MNIYLNPYELLGLKPEASDVEIRKAKRRLLAEMALNDDMLDLGLERGTLNKSDFLQLVERLENPQEAILFKLLANEQSLVSFLISGDLSLFKTKDLERLFKNKKLFDFALPFFVSQFKTRLKKAYVNQNRQELVLLTSPNYPNDCHDLLYKDLYDEIHRHIPKRLEQGMTETQLKFFVSKFIDSYSSKIILFNSLPAYFDLLKNDLAIFLRYISVEIFNETSDLLLAQSALKLAESLNTSGQTKQLIQEARETLDGIGIKQESEKIIADFVPYVNDVLSLYKKIVDKIERCSKNEAISMVNTYVGKIDVDKINGFTVKSNNDQFSSLLAQTICNLAVALYNTHDEEGVSLSILEKAAKLQVNLDVKKRINENLNSIKNIINKKYENAFKEIEAHISTIVLAIKSIQGNRGKSINQKAVENVISACIRDYDLALLSVKISSVKRNALAVQILSIANQFNRDVNQQLEILLKKLSVDYDFINKLNLINASSSSTLQASNVQSSVQNSSVSELKEEINWATIIFLGIVIMFLISFLKS